jgi:hypothetical protein
MTMTGAQCTALTGHCPETKHSWESRQTPAVLASAACDSALLLVDESIGLIKARLLLLLLLLLQDQGPVPPLQGPHRHPPPARAAGSAAVKGACRALCSRGGCAVPGSCRGSGAAHERACD